MHVNRSVEEALELYFSGSMLDALESLGDQDNLYADYLRTRIFSRLQRQSAAIEVIETLRERRLDDVDQMLEREIVSVFPLIAVGRTDDAADAISRGLHMIRFDHSVDLESELHYLDAATHFAKSDYVEAEKAANRSLSACDEIFSRGERPALSSSRSSHTRAKALQLIAIVRSQDRRYHEQARLIRLALIHLQKSEPSDAYLLAMLKMNLSYYVRDMSSIQDLPLLDHHPWPDELSLFEAEIFRSRAICEAGQGDFDGFLVNIERAERTFDSEPYRLILKTDRLFIDRNKSGSINAIAIKDCIASCLAIDWNSDKRYQYALKQVAQEISFTEIDAALHFIDLYDQLSPDSDPFQVHDDRDQAEISFARGIVARNAGMECIDYFMVAFDKWNGIGYRRYAAMAAIELSELTRIESFKLYAAREVSLCPQSWLARRMHRA